jgi:hypothetical protein
MGAELASSPTGMLVFVWFDGKIAFGIVVQLFVHLSWSLDDCDENICCPVPGTS